MPEATPNLTPLLYLQLPTWSLVLTGVGTWYCVVVALRASQLAATTLVDAWRRHQRRRQRRTPTTTATTATLRYTNPFPSPSDLRGLDLSAGVSPEQLALLARTSSPLPEDAQRQIRARLYSLPCTRDPQRHR